MNVDFSYSVTKWTKSKHRAHTHYLKTVYEHFNVNTEKARLRFPQHICHSLMYVCCDLNALK